MIAAVARVAAFPNLLKKDSSVETWIVHCTIGGLMYHESLVANPYKETLWLPCVLRWH